MVFGDDSTNDPRIAIEDQWAPFAGAKQWISLVSDRNGACVLTADHLVPATDSNLIDGSNPLAQTAMGTWTSNGAPVARAQRSEMPSAPRDSSAYMFPVTQRTM